ncbi:MAG: hypothetical protein AUK16_01435 [Parcubacteria group bacterium CG2_30_44_11]|nr:MAG: hypothetical protein AUK16_01435 [Parcubacteria group bacterium CG2_30_44_11]
MSRAKVILIRVVASFVYCLRRRAILRVKNKWIVVTGSVGKTIMRQTLAGALRQAKQNVVSLKSNYVNELGVLCTLFQIDNFSIKSLRSWWALLTKSPVSGAYLCIELGADFRTDILWFLKRFLPYAVFETTTCELDWTQVLQEVKVERNTLQHGSTFTYVLDDTSEIYVPPVEATKTFLRHEKIELTEEIIPYSSGRLVQQTCQNAEIICDTYKVTPRCLTYSLTRCLNTKSSRKVFLMNEVRPLLVTPAFLYEPILAQLRQLDELYFVGNKQVYAYLKEQLRITYLEGSDVPKWKRVMQERIAGGESLCIGIKVSTYYHLEALREW